MFLLKVLPISFLQGWSQNVLPTLNPGHFYLLNSPEPLYREFHPLAQTQ